MGGTLSLWRSCQIWRALSSEWVVSTSSTILASSSKFSTNQRSYEIVLFRSLTTGSFLIKRPKGCHEEWMVFYPFIPDVLSQKVNGLKWASRQKYEREQMWLTLMGGGW